MDVQPSQGSMDLKDVDFDLLGDWDGEDVKPTQLMNIPTQSLFNVKNNGRFSAPLSASDIAEKELNAVPLKTRQNESWAMKFWKDWAENRNLQVLTHLEGNPIPEDPKDLSHDMLDFWLQRFICEIRRKNGDPYSPNTLTQIASAIQRYLRNKCEKVDINFSKEDNPVFAGFRKALDSRMKELTGNGIGVNKKRSDPVTQADEEKFWDTGVFSLDTAEGLSNAVFYYNGKAFGFRGMEWHKNLDAEQYEIKTDAENNLQYIQFTARISKNVQRGLKHKNVENQIVKHNEQPENTRCLVKLYSIYLSLIPRVGPFYGKPLIESFISKSENKVPRFSAGKISINVLSSMFKEFYEEAGIPLEGRTITNHSGRVTLCTSLYNSGYNDKAVAGRSGHRSNAIQKYQREQFPILKEISNTLAPPEPKNENTGLTRRTETDVNEDDCVFLSVPKCIKKLIIQKGDKKITVEI